jgi:hypothetical protein
LKKLLSILALLYSFTAFSQTENGNIFNRDTISSFQTMHVHFDKDIYLPGETIWFKAYLYNVLEISTAASNFYAAIYDDMGKLLQQKQYPIIGGTCNGDFEIPDSIQGSRIQFRAFTRAMIQNDNNNIYTRILSVYNKEGALNIPDKKNIQLEFFTEGGNMVAWLENHIAFKASFADGSPAKITGQIIEVERDKIIDSFYANDLGLGKIILRPWLRKNYIAVWKDENGITNQTKLPVIIPAGVVLHSEISNNEIICDIAKNKSNDSLNELHLLIQSGNYQVYNADISLANEMEIYSFKIPLTDIPVGLLQLSLIDKYQTVLQQRILFNADNNYTKRVEIKTDSITLNAKGRSEIEITLQDTTLTNLSISVSDANFYHQASNNSIIQELLFCTQLKELNLNAAAIIKDTNRKITDLVMLTHHWRKYNWRQLTVNKNTNPAMLDDYITLTINYNERNKTLPQEDALNLIINDKDLGEQLYTLKPVNSYSFKKGGLIFFGAVKVGWQMNKNKTLSNYLAISKSDSLKFLPDMPAFKNNFYPSIASAPFSNKTIEIFRQGSISKFNEIKTIKEVIVKSAYKGNVITARINELDKTYTSGMFSGTVRGYQLNVIDDTLGVKAGNNLRDYIRYRVPGLELRKNTTFGKWQYQSSEDMKTVVPVFVPTLVFLNETQLNPEEDNPFDFIVLSDVAYVKYLPGIVLGSSTTSTSGAIYIYTKKGNEKTPATKGIPNIYITGYSPAKEFVVPGYTDKASMKKMDLRSTIYWNPNVVLDKSVNKIKLRFFNNDISKKIVLKIEGVNAAGKLIYFEKIIE